MIRPNKQTVKPMGYRADNIFVEFYVIKFLLSQAKSNRFIDLSLNKHDEAIYQKAEPKSKVKDQWGQTVVQLTNIIDEKVFWKRERIAIFAQLF